MNCNNCGNIKAYRCAVWHEEDESGKRVMRECCDRCGNAGAVSVSDVFWDGKPEINLADDPRTGKPMVFESRAAKAAYLKEHGLVQVDGRNHGSLGYGVSSTAEKDFRPMIRETIREVKNMGRDVRRSMVWKIIKDAKAFDSYKGR